MGATTSNDEARAFEKTLERTLKRFDAREVAKTVALLLRAPQKPDFVCKYPPHRLLRLLEAACMYGWKPGVAPFGYQDLFDSLNLLNKRGDPSAEQLLSGASPNLFQAFRILAHSQFAIQAGEAEYPFVRQLAIFPSEEACPCIAALIRQLHGCSLDEFSASLLLVKTLGASSQGGVSKDALLDTVGDARAKREVLASVLQTACWDRHSFRAHYQAVRRHHTNAAIWDHLPSPFIAKPVLDFGTHLMAPSPQLADQFAGTAVWRMARVHKGAVRRELGACFERYVGALLGEVPNTTVIRGKELKVGEHKHCDYLASVGKVVTMIECKSVISTARLATDGAVAGSGGLRAVRDGFLQLGATARAVRGGAFASRGIPPDARMIGLVVTLEELAMPNHEASVRLIESLCEGNAGQRPAGWIADLDKDIGTPPQAMGCGSFELLASTLRSGLRIDQIIDGKLALPYIQAGEWSTYLRKLAVERSATLPLVWGKALSRFQQACRDVLPFADTH